MPVKAESVWKWVGPERVREVREAIASHVYGGEIDDAGLAQLGEALNIEEPLDFEGMKAEMGEEMFNKVWEGMDQVLVVDKEPVAEKILRRLEDMAARPDEAWVRGRVLMFRLNDDEDRQLVEFLDHELNDERLRNSWPPVFRDPLPTDFVNAWGSRLERVAIELGKVVDEDQVLTMGSVAVVLGCSVFTANSLLRYWKKEYAVESVNGNVIYKFSRHLRAIVRVEAQPA